jgi:hypothetical protein
VAEEACPKAAMFKDAKVTRVRGVQQEKQSRYNKMDYDIDMPAKWLVAR